MGSFNNKPPEIDRVDSDEQTDRSLAQTSDPHGVITPEVAVSARELCYLIACERQALGFKPYSDTHRRILFGELVTAVHAHEEHSRDSGKPYHTHLLGTARNLVVDQGLTGVPMMVAGLHHDTVEDTKAPLDHIVRLDDYGIREEDLPPELRGIQQTVRVIVEGLTKIKERTKEATDIATFEHLLKTIRNHGVRVANVKLADRTDNMKDIRNHEDPERQVEITRQTEQVYVLLAHVLKIRETLTKLVEYCVQFDNPALFGDFNGLLRTRLDEFLAPVRADIEEKFSPTVDGNQADREFLRQNVVGIEFMPAALADFALQGIPFRDLAIEDLRINPLNSLFAVKVVTRPTAERRDVMSYIVRCFGEYGRVELVPNASEKPPKKGAMVKVYSRKHRGVLTFWVIDALSDRFSKRGVLAEAGDGLSPDMRVAIDQIIAAAQRDKSRIFRLAEERLLRPTIAVYTPRNEKIELPSGSTPLDFAAALHPVVLIGLQRAWILPHIFGDSFEKVRIFDALPDGVVVKVDSCLTGGKRDYTRIKVDPGWLLFCQTERAKDVLKKAWLREQPEEHETNRVVGQGVAYLERVSRLFCLSGETILAAIKSRSRRLRISDDNTILHQMGRGSLEILHIIADVFFKERQQWRITVELPDKPGGLHTFIEEFKRQGINIDEIWEERNGAACTNGSSHANRAKMGLRISSADRTKQPLDMLKIFLKLSYEYDLSVVSGAAAVALGNP